MTGAVTLRRASEHVRMPWKNGGGTTTEIAVYPAGALLDAFGWRVSMAEVAKDGPFSEFPGVDRTLALLSGNGMRLRIGNDRLGRLISVESKPISFPADAPAFAELLDGPVRDLNVMTRRGAWRHVLDRIVVVGTKTLAADAPVSLLLCHQGRSQIETNTGTIELAPGDAVHVEGPLGSLAAQATSILFRIGLWPEPTG